ncbi:F-box and Leucine Rich Repeat domains containing protein [Hibiscus syriacus]|uniref:F-box and Leucine Rich Repeat domains containing protein n=1 Tax=Hibiscus syriacus TaxID=106335 RepID=A0A6A3BLQ2_HIBSY|nr:F-box and Leucine Rich Repeat domains containing protein [Hibiscus syriacus]
MSVQEPSLSASDSRNSFDSLDGSYREIFSPHNGVMSNLIGRQDSTGSQTCSPHRSYSFTYSSRSNHSGAPKLSSSGSHSHNHKEDSNRASLLVPSSPLRNAGSSKNVLEYAEITIGDLRAEARMWDQNARKLMIDMEKLQKEFFDLANRQKSLETALSTSQAECDCMKKEIKQVKILLEESQMKQAASNSLKFQIKNTDSFQKELEDEISSWKLSRTISYLDDELSKCRAREEQEIEIVALQQQLQRYQQKEIESKDRPVLTFEEFTISKSPEAIEISTLLAELHEQIQLSLAELKRQSGLLNSHANPAEIVSDDSKILKSKDLMSQNQQVQIILNNFFRQKQYLGESSETEKLKPDNLLKEDELEALRHHQKELEAQVSSVQKEKSQLEENKEIMLREAAVTAKCSEDLRSEMMVLNSNVDSQISANQVLIKKSTELESGKQELEVHLSELEEENLQLSERISGLEAQLRYLTGERVPSSGTTKFRISRNEI